MTSSVMQFAYEGYQMNLLDTPGHEDFSEDTYRMLVAADSAVMLLDNRKGVEERTRQLFAVCKRRRMPIFTFVNKCDRVGEDPLKLIGDVEADLGIDCHPITWPIHADGAFVGVYDRRREARSTGSSAARITARAAPKCRSRRSTIRRFASCSAPRRTSGSCTTSRCSTRRGIRSTTRPCSPGELSPVFFGSALTNFGVEPFLESSSSSRPPPAARESTTGLDRADGRAVHRVRVQDPGEHGPRSIATASRSCASAPAGSRRACR